MPAAPTVNLFACGQFVPNPRLRFKCFFPLSPKDCIHEKLQWRRHSWPRLDSTCSGGTTNRLQNLSLFPILRPTSSIFSGRTTSTPPRSTRLKKYAHPCPLPTITDSNEALEASFPTGKSGYDLSPVHCNVGRQIKAGAYQKIDKSQIPNYANIDADLLAMMAKSRSGN